MRSSIPTRQGSDRKEARNRDWVQEHQHTHKKNCFLGIAKKGGGEGFRACPNCLEYFCYWGRELFDFLPTPLAVVWVFRWTFSPSSSPSYHQLFVSLRYRKCCGGGAWVLGCVCHLVYYRGIIWVLCMIPLGMLKNKNHFFDGFSPTSQNKYEREQ